MDALPICQSTLRAPRPVARGYATLLTIMDSEGSKQVERPAPKDASLKPAVMPDSPTDPASAQRLEEAWGRGEPFDEIHAQSVAPDPAYDDLCRNLVALHNDGRIDVIAAYRQLTVERAPSRFFEIRAVFEEILAQLDGDMAATMHCVMHLYDAAGSDLASHTIFGPFESYCSGHASRPQEALNLIIAEPETLAGLLRSVLLAGCRHDTSRYVADAIGFVGNPNIHIRRRATSALCHVIKASSNEAHVDRAFVALEQLLSQEEDDQVLAGITASASDLAMQNPDSTARAARIVTFALQKGKAATRYAAAFALQSSAGPTAAVLAQALCENILPIDSKASRTIGFIDSSIGKLIKHHYSDLAMKLVEGLLLSPVDPIQMSALPIACGELRKDQLLLASVVAHWLGGGKRALCMAIQTICTDRQLHENGMEINLDASRIRSLPEGHAYFLARKAIGFLFDTPVTACSIVLSALATEKPEREAIGQLLFDPLLLNHSSIKEYLATKAQSIDGKIKAIVEAALKSLEDYLSALRAIGRLEALEPSLKHQEAYARQMQLEMTSAFRKAQSQSLIMQLVTKRTLLYGAKSIHYLQREGGSPVRSEILLQRHSSSFSIPRMQVIDPLGTEYMLRCFRVEQIQDETHHS